MTMANNGRSDGMMGGGDAKKRAKRRLLGTAVLSFFAVCTLPLVFKSPDNHLSHPTLVMKRGNGLYECAATSADAVVAETVSTVHKSSPNERFISVQSSAHLPGHILISTQGYQNDHTVQHAHTPRAPAMVKKHPGHTDHSDSIK